MLCICYTTVPGRCTMSSGGDQPSFTARSWTLHSRGGKWCHPPKHWQNIHFDSDPFSDLYEKFEIPRKTSGKSFMWASICEDTVWEPNQSIIGAALVTLWQSTQNSRAVWRLADTEMGWPHRVLQHIISQSHTHFLLFRPLEEFKIWHQEKDIGPRGLVAAPERRVPLRAHSSTSGLHTLKTKIEPTLRPWSTVPRNIPNSHFQ